MKVLNGSEKIRIAFLTTDNREQQKCYEKEIPYFGPAPAALLEGFSKLSGEIEVHVLSCTRRRMHSPEKLAENIWFHQPYVPHLGWGRSLFLGCARAVRQVLRKVNPDLVHGQGTERDCAMSAVLSGHPNVITLHGNMRAVARSFSAKKFSYYGMASLLETFALRRTDGVLCNSAYTESQVGTLCARKWRVPNCVNDRFFNPLPESETRANLIVVLGSIIHYKQSSGILRMWAELAPRHPNVNLAFIGRDCGGPHSQEFHALLSSPAIAGRVKYIDWLEGEQLVEFLDSARGMIHFPTEEAFGLAVAEGLARNLKLFAARTGGVPDVAKGCSEAEFYEADDWNGLADGISRWIDAGLPLTGSAEVIRARFAPEAIARQHLHIYRSVVAPFNRPK